jgi:Uma2 family endonuclease
MTLAATKLMTAEMLEVLPHQGRRLELIKGELRELMAASGDHGDVTMELAWCLKGYAKQHNLGNVFAAKTGFIADRNPDTVRAPDISFLSRAKIELLGGVPKGFISIAPDLAVETVSPNDLYTESHDKALMWLEFGTTIVLLVNPRKSNITVYHSKKEIFVLEADDVLELPKVLPGFTIAVADIFNG